MTVPEGDAYERGVAAGEIAQRLREHDQHLALINGSMGRLADEMHLLVLQVQRLGDAADADRATVVTTASALEKADAARRDNSETRWSPLARTLTVAGLVVAALTAILLYASLHAGGAPPSPLRPGGAPPRESHGSSPPPGAWRGLSPSSPEEEP